MARTRYGEKGRKYIKAGEGEAKRAGYTGDTIDYLGTDPGITGVKPYRDQLALDALKALELYEDTSGDPENYNISDRLHNLYLRKEDYKNYLRNKAMPTALSGHGIDNEQMIDFMADEWMKSDPQDPERRPMSSTERRYEKEGMRGLEDPVEQPTGLSYSVNTDPDLAGPHQIFAEQRSPKPRVSDISSKFLEDFNYGDFSRNREMAGGEGVDKWGRTPGQIQEVDSLKFMFNDLISPDNLMNPEKISRLKLELNKYLFGSNTLKIDGNYDRDLQSAINMYKSASRYWHPSESSWVNPHGALESWNASQKDSSSVPLEDFK